MKLLFKILFSVSIIFYPFISNGYFYDEYKDFDKVIKVNTYYEKLSYYEKGVKIGQMDISTGDYENQTPTGRFKVMTKHERMFSKSAGKWMPYWMEFYDGVYGIHGIPETYSGKKTSIESDVIGNSAAGGCVRLGEENIIKLYQWSDYDTVVLISYDKDEIFDNKDKKIEIDGKDTLKQYLDYIIEDEYFNAYSLESKHKYKFRTFKKLHTLIDIDYKNINKINNVLYEVDIYIYYKGEEIISGKKIKFKVLDGKIIKSYYL